MIIETKEQIMAELKKMLDASNYSGYGYFLIVSEDMADILELPKEHWKTTPLFNGVDILREVPMDLEYPLFTLKNQTMFLIPKHSKNENIKDRYYG